MTDVLHVDSESHQFLSTTTGQFTEYIFDRVNNFLESILICYDYLRACYCIKSNEISEFPWISKNIFFMGYKN